MQQYLQSVLTNEKHFKPERKSKDKKQLKCSNSLAYLKSLITHAKNIMNTNIKSLKYCHHFLTVQIKNQINL